MFHSAYCNHSYHDNANHSSVVLCNASYMKTIADRIKDFRLEKKLSQEALAAAVGVSRVAVTKWESGQTENLKLSNITELCRIFKTSYEFLITGTALDEQKTTDIPRIENGGIKDKAIERVVTAMKEMDERSRSLILGMVIAESRHLHPKKAQAKKAA